MMTAASTTLFLLAGIAAGQAYFGAMRRSLAAFAAGSRMAPLLLTVGRLASILLFLLLAVRLGAPPLLAAFIGFLIARAIAVRAAEGRERC